MYRILLFSIFLIVPAFAFGQVLRPEKKGVQSRGTNNTMIRDNGDSQQSVINKKDKPNITKYQIISVTKDTTFVDTTLNIYKDYKFNYLRKDNFELLPLSNVGPKYNQLSYNFGEDYSSIGGFGAEAKHTNFFETEDIFYYHVPTPLTELYFKTAIEQGQQLDAFFTSNITPNLNFSIAYKGLRSLGKYKRSLTSSGNFRSTINYNTVNKRYQLKMHFVAQDILTQENGGLTEAAIHQYINEAEEVDDRTLLEVNLSDAENVLIGKRFYLNHTYQINKPDSISINLYEIGHILNFSDKKYLFKQAAPDSLLGPSFLNENLRDEVKREYIYNQIFFGYQNKKIGRLKLKTALSTYNYGYNSIIIFEDETVVNRLLGETVSVGADYYNNVGGFDLEVNAMANVIGDVPGSLLSAKVTYNISTDNSITLKAKSMSQQPNFNFLLYQSDYINYNWQNDFKNEKINLFSIQLQLKKIAAIDLSYSQINNYTYFALNEDTLVKPFQANTQIGFLKLKVGREFNFGKFALANILLFQSVTEGQDLLNVPDLVARNSFYFQDHLFRKSLFLQTGLTVKYFSNYTMNGYDPVLSEFYVQNENELNGFPTLDFFLNAKIRQTRIFFKLENLNSAFVGNTEFSAPSYPYRDFGIRFGLVWNFFL